MKAMKCDRCGKIYIEEGGRNVKTIAIHKQDWDGDYPWEPCFIDLCPECLDELVEFLANKEEKEDENTKEEVEHTCCCCEEKKSNMNGNADLNKLFDEFLKTHQASPLEICFIDRLFVKGENEDE